MAGPPPKHPDQRRRTNATIAMTQLPAGGRKGAVPKWTLDGQGEAEGQVWDELWTTPQAAMWERLGWTRVVARYCRALVAAEAQGAAPAVMAECRQLEDRLGLSPMSMLRLRWEVAADEVAAKRTTRAKPRTRLKAVDPGAAAQG